MTQQHMLPHNKEAEEGIFTHILSNTNKLTTIMDKLLPSHFYHDQYCSVYEAMLALAARNKPCTPSNVYQEMKRAGRADDRLEDELERIHNNLDAYLTPLDDHVDDVIFCATMRTMIGAAQEITQLAWTKDPSTVTRAEELIYSIALGAYHKPVSPLSDVLDTYMDDFSKRRAEKLLGRARGVPTGFPDVDRLLGGLQPSRLHTLAGSTGGGKTAIALNIAFNAILANRHVLFFSLEMDEEELAQRLLSMDALIPQEFLRDAEINAQDEAHLNASVRLLHDKHLKIDDRTYTLAGIKSRAKKVHAQKPLDLIVIDYLQLVDVSPEGRAKGVNRSEEVGQLSKGLKRLARDLKVPVLILSQLNREADHAASPQLSHLYESGKIAQDSDVVVFLHVEEEEQARRNECLPYKVKVIVRKNRNGRIGTESLMFRPRLTKFEGPDWEAPSYDQN